MNAGALHIRLGQIDRVEGLLQKFLVFGKTGQYCQTPHGGLRRAKVGRRHSNKRESPVASPIRQVNSGSGYFLLTSASARWQCHFLSCQSWANNGVDHLRGFANIHHL
jgi:hypothetical protein